MRGSKVGEGWRLTSRGARVVPLSLHPRVPVGRARIARLSARLVAIDTTGNLGEDPQGFTRGVRARLKRQPSKEDSWTL